MLEALSQELERQGMIKWAADTADLASSVDAMHHDYTESVIDDEGA